MCWSVEVSTGIALFEFAVIVYAWRRNAWADRAMVPLLFSVFVVELSEAMQWSMGVPRVHNPKDGQISFSYESRKACSELTTQNFFNKLTMQMAVIAVDLQPYFMSIYVAATLQSQFGWKASLLKIDGLITLARTLGRFLFNLSLNFKHVCMVGPGEHGHVIWSWGYKVTDVSLWAAFTQFAFYHEATVGVLFFLPHLVLRHTALKFFSATAMIFFYFAFYIYPTGPEAESFWCLFGVHASVYVLVQP